MLLMALSTMSNDENEGAPALGSTLTGEII